MRFYVWKTANGIQSACRIIPPDHPATDCTDMTDQQFEEFMRMLDEQAGSNLPNVCIAGGSATKQLDATEK